MASKKRRDSSLIFLSSHFTSLSYNYRESCKEREIERRDFGYKEEEKLKRLGCCCSTCFIIFWDDLNQKCFSSVFFWRRRGGEDISKKYQVQQYQSYSTCCQENNCFGGPFCCLTSFQIFFDQFMMMFQRNRLVLKCFLFASHHFTLHSIACVSSVSLDFSELSPVNHEEHELLTCCLVVCLSLSFLWFKSWRKWEE